MHLEDMAKFVCSRYRVYYARFRVTPKFSFNFRIKHPETKKLSMPRKKIMTKIKS